MSSLDGQFVSCCRYLGLARRLMTDRPMFGAARERFYRNYWSEAAHDVGAEISELGQGYLKISKGDRSTLVQLHHVNLDSYLNLMLVGNKPLIHAVLREHGYSVPRFVQYKVSDLDSAWAFMNEVKGRCVVKPVNGSGGIGITTGVNSRWRLRRASLAAASAYYREKLVIEQEVEGDSYRLLFLGGKLIDAVRRRRPTVVGDGTTSIRGLIDRENRERLGSGPSRSFTCLTVDLDCRSRLKDNGIGLTSVPAAGETVVVKNVANQNAARDNVTVRDEVHPYFHKLGSRLSSLLGVNLIGVDVMSADISVALDENGGVVNELNIPPGLHYHELIDNPDDKADVAGQILDYIFSDANLTIESSTPPRIVSASGVR
jgi:D-alanine-D-alanine ligase-like ATP-grasp enzyme